MLPSKNIQAFLICLPFPSHVLLAENLHQPHLFRATDIQYSSSRQLELLWVWDSSVPQPPVPLHCFVVARLLYVKSFFRNKLQYLTGVTIYSSHQGTWREQASQRRRTSWRSGQQLSSSNQAENLINASALGFGMQGEDTAFHVTSRPSYQQQPAVFFVQPSMPGFLQIRENESLAN